MILVVVFEPESPIFVPMSKLNVPDPPDLSFRTSSTIQVEFEFVPQVSSLTIPLAPPDPILSDIDDDDDDDPVLESPSSSQKNLGNSPNSKAGSGYGKKLSSSGVERRDRGSSCE